MRCCVFSRKRKKVTEVDRGNGGLTFRKVNLPDEQVFQVDFLEKEDLQISNPFSNSILSFNCKLISNADSGARSGASPPSMLKSPTFSTYDHTAIKVTKCTLPTSPRMPYQCKLTTIRHSNWRKSVSPASNQPLPGAPSERTGVLETSATLTSHEKRLVQQHIKHIPLMVGAIPSEQV